MHDGSPDPDDGGLGRALGDLGRQRREQEAEQRQRQAAEEVRRTAHVSTIQHALEAQDETTRKAVAAFLSRAAQIVPGGLVPIGSVLKRRFVPFAVETYRETVSERAHLIFRFSQDLTESAGETQSVAMLSNGVVMFSHDRMPLPAVPHGDGTHDGSSRLYGFGTWYARAPKDQPGLLPFWVPEPHSGVAPLRLGPSDDDEMTLLTEVDIERTTEWFVRALATYLDEHVSAPPTT